MSGWVYSSECSCGWVTPTRDSRWRLVLDKVWHDLRRHKAVVPSALYVRR